MGSVLFRGYGAGSLPATYLGLRLCLGVALKILWSPVVERMERKLAPWKAKYLSLGGHTIIKLALSNFSSISCLCLDVLLLLLNVSN